MSESQAALARELTDTLLAARNPDGGWPYYKGKTSRLEPTCTALLALSAASGQPVPISKTPLQSWPRRDGLFVDAAGEINVAFNGLAGLALASDARSTLAIEVTHAITVTRGIQLPRATINRQDDSIQAWPWTEGTFSWVESTGWCMLALKKLTAAPRPPAVLRRIADGERLLADRVCRDGGWNHGNSNMLGTELAPHVPTTALGLLSLHDRIDAPHVVRSLDYLEAHQQTESGALALSLAAICLAVFGRPSGGALTALEAEWRRSRFIDNVHVTSLALVAVIPQPHHCEAFRV